MTEVRKRIVKALHTCASLPALREELVLVLCDLEEEQTPTLRSVSIDETDAPRTQPESAPSVPTESELGKEYGP